MVVNEPVMNKLWIPAASGNRYNSIDDAPLGRKLWWKDLLATKKARVVELKRRPVPWSLGPVDIQDTH